MAFCANCGAEVQGRFCAKCGTPMGAPGASGSSTDTGASGSQPYSAPGGYQQAPPPPGAQPYSHPPAQTGGLSDNMAAALSYLFTVITGILFLVLEPYNRSKFVRFHAFQSIFFFAAWMVFWILMTILTYMLPFGLGFLLGLLSIVVWLGGLAVWILLMVKAYNNERFKLPVIGDLAEKQA
jgi:uncharacterized membrane protein